MPHKVQSQFCQWCTMQWHKLFHSSTSKLLKLESKASLTVTTNTWRSTGSMRAPQPISLTTCSRLLASFTLASPSLQNTLAQLLCMSSRVRNICGIFNLNWSQYIGEIHVVDNTKPGETTKLNAGDVIHFAEGTQNISTTPGKAKCTWKNEIIYLSGNVLLIRHFASHRCLLRSKGHPPRGFDCRETLNTLLPRPYQVV